MPKPAPLPQNRSLPAQELPYPNVYLPLSFLPSPRLAAPPNLLTPARPLMQMPQWTSRFLAQTPLRPPRMPLPIPTTPRLPMPKPMRHLLILIPPLMFLEMAQTLPTRQTPPIPAISRLRLPLVNLALRVKRPGTAKAASASTPPPAKSARALAWTAARAASSARN